MTKKRLIAVVLSLVLLSGSISASPLAYAEDVDTEPAEIRSTDSKLTRENAEYDIVVASVNTDTTEKLLTLSELLGNESVPAENVAVSPQSTLGDISDIITAYSFTDGTFSYAPAERPADGKTGTIVYTVSSDDYNDFTITVNLEAQDTREEIEDIEFNELEVDPEEWAGIFTGYSLSEIAAAAFDDPTELTKGFVYHGVSFSENAQAVLDEIETYYTDDWDGYFVFTFEEPLERGNTAWVRYEVSSDKFKPFGLILYFTVPKLERNNASQAVNIDAFSGDRTEKVITVSELLSGKNVPQKDLQLTPIMQSDNFDSVISSIRFEDNSLIYTPAENLNIGVSADIAFEISSGDYENFMVTIFFNVIDGRRVFKNTSYTIKTSYKNTDTSESSLSFESIFGGADKLPEGLLLDLDSMTVSESISRILSSYDVSESGIVYSFKENPASSASAKIEIPAIADNYKPFTVTITFNVSEKTASAYVVHFSTDGGSKIENEVVSRGARVAKPASPKKDGYIFDGWYTTADFEKEYDFTRSVGRNFTLYAKWIPVAVDEADDESDNEINDETNNKVGEDNESIDVPIYSVKFTIGSQEADIFGESVTYDVAPVIVSGRTMLPARYVAENLGARVEWDSSLGAGTVTITKGDTEIVLFIGEMYATVNGEKVDLDTEPFIQSGRTFYPARFIAERLGASVAWDESLRTVTITTTEKPVWNPMYAD